MEPKKVAFVALILEIVGVVFLATFPAWPQPSSLVIQGSSEIAQFLGELREYFWWVGPLLLSAGFWMQYRAIIISNPSR